jgi:hypothetical protein
VRRNILQVIFAALLTSFHLLLFPVMASEDFSPFVDGKGNISLPDNFRTTMVHLGSWFVPEGGASGFHHVYTEKATVASFRQTGKFPDGAVLIKELRASKPGSYTTGESVSYATSGIKQWFVMVKDSKGRFSDNPQWGDGWGWALFKPDNPGKNVSFDYSKDCLGCHLPARDKDLIYTEAYPTLLK